MSARSKTMSLCLFVSLAIFGRASSSSVASPPAPALQTGEADHRIAREISGYRGWAKATPEPSRYDSSVAAMCAASVPSPARSDPHADKFILVYVNETGRKALLEERVPVFPAGSIIVKEKLPGADTQTPELLTVMVKREKGFNAALGDWEFAVLDGSAQKVVASGRLENCASCHTTRRESGFVFRNYIPPSRKAKWQ